MMNKRSVLLIILIVFFSVSPAVSGARSPRVGDLKIYGNERVSVSRIKDVMDTRSPSFLQRLPLIRRPRYNETILRRDISAVMNLYRSLGYYSADAGFEVERIRNRRYITVFIEEGEPARISSIDISGISPEDGDIYDLVRGSITLREGEVFRIRDYDDTLESVRTALTDNGYGAGEAEGRVRIFRKSAEALVELTVTPGPFQRFGELQVEGNRIVKDEDIAYEAAFSPGDPFSKKKLDRTRRNIIRLGLFDLVRVYSPEPARERVPVIAEVEESPMRSLRAGVGYGTEDRFRGSAEWSREYLFNRLMTLRLSGEYSSLLTGGKVEVSRRRYPLRRMDMRYEVGFDREEAPAYVNERILSQLRAGVSITENLDGFAALRFEFSRPSGVEESVRQEIIETRPGEFYRISGVQAGVNYINVDSPSFPRRGGKLSLYAEPSLPVLGSDIGFVKAVGEARGYAEALGFVVAVKLRAGAAEPLAGTRIIPVFKRFFSGGSHTVRGYRYQSLGPEDPAGEPLGGNYLFESSAELRYPIAGGVSGSFFLDAGNVFGRRMRLGAEELKYGLGAGIRFSTPVGPVGVDAAVPFEYGKSLQFSRYRIYFNIGYAI